LNLAGTVEETAAEDFSAFIETENSGFNLNPVESNSFEKTGLQSSLQASLLINIRLRAKRK
jgi:hypothetical protein